MSILAIGKYIGFTVMGNLNKVWQATIGNKIIDQGLAAKMPKNLHELLAAEEEIVAEWKRKMAAQGVQVTMKTIREAPFPQRVAMMRALKAARDAHPTHAALATSLEQEMWNVWHHAPTTYRNFFAREITYGLMIGLVGGAYWKYGYDYPLQEKTEDYYRQLYKQNPELWPALTQRK